MGRQKKLDGAEILKAIALSPDPVVTAPELAGQIEEYGEDGVRHRLKELRDRGLVNSRDVGARATVWWITPDGRAAIR